MKLKIVYLLLKNKIKPHIGSDTRFRIAKGAFWGTAGAIVSKGIVIVLSFALARILGKNGYGEYGMINNTAAMISSFAGLGLGATVTRYIASLREREPERAGKIIGLSSIITWCSAVIYGIIFIFLAKWLAEKTLSAPQLAPMLQISSISIGLGVVNSVQVSTLTGLESFRTSSILSTIFAFIQSLLVIVFAWFGGVKGATIALSLTSCLTVVVYYLVSKKELKRVKIKVTFKDAWIEWRVLVRYSLPAFLSTTTVGPIIWAANAFLANQPNGYGELGLFNAALQWDALVQFFPALISTAALPVMSDMYGKGDKNGSVKLMWKLMKYTAILVVPIAIIVSLLSPQITKGYGSSFIGGHWVIVIVVFTTVFVSISNQLGIYIAASGKMWIGFALNSIWGFTFLILSYFMVRFGAEGLAAAKFIAYVFHFLWSLIICIVLNKIINRSQHNFGSAVD